MKVLFNSYNTALHGGPATHLRFLEAELSKSLQLVRYQYERKSDTETAADKVLGRSADLLRLHRLIRAERPDLIHHNSSLDLRALLRDVPLARLARFHKIPIFMKFHGTSRFVLSSTNPFVASLRNSLFRNVDCIGVLSEVEKDELGRACPPVADRVAVVKNILAEEFGNVERCEAPAPTVLFISRFIREKGMFDLLRAVPEVLKKCPDVHFTFVGSGSDEGAFEQEVRRLHLNGAVERVPHVSNLETLTFYSSAWMFVFPTTFPEGMPMVVAQAMAAGVPIITTPTRFSRSYMREGDHCLYIGYNDPDSIAKQICLLVRDKNLRERMSVNNRGLTGLFSAQQVAGEFVRLYERMLKRGWNAEGAAS